MCPGFAAIGIVLGNKGIPDTAIGQSIQVALSITTDIDSTVAACGYGIGTVLTAGSQELCPGFAAIGIVLGDKGITSTVIGLSIQVAFSITTEIDSTVAACG